MTPLFPFTADLIRAFGWTIIHSVWQAFFVYACLRIVLTLWPMANARIKYNLSFLSLAGIFTWFIITLYQQIAAVQHTAIPLSATEFQLLTSSAAWQPAPTVYQNEAELVGLFPNLEMCFPILVALYIAGISIMIIKLVIDVHQLRQIRKKQVVPIDALWEKHLAQLTKQLGIPRKVRLMVSKSLQVPVMIGFLKPLILLPMAMVNNMNEDQLEAILLHELAHIKRNDYLLNIFQSIAETILFFNPFIWWISKNIRQEREHCCDDVVIASSVQPLHYARALVALEEHRLNSNPLAMAAADNKQYLFYRIKRIMEMKTKNLNYSQKILAVLIIATGLISIAWLNPAHQKDNCLPQQTPTQETLLISQPITTPAPVIGIMSVIPNVQAEPLAFKTIATPPAAILPVPKIPAIHNVIAPVPPIPQDTIPPATEKSPVAPSNEDEQKLAAAREKMRQAQNQMREAEETMREINWKNIREAQQEAMKNIDWEKMSKAQQEAMKNIDWKKMSKAQQEAMKNIDWKKMNKDIALAMQNIDWKEISKAQQEAMKNIDWKKIQRDVQAAQQNVNWDELRTNVKEGMKQAKAGVEQAQKERLIILKELQDTQREMRKSLTESTTLQQGKAERDNYQQFINKMAADKLLDTNQPFIIEKKNNDLYINGIMQLPSVTEKYSKYLNKTQKMTIRGENNNLEINIDNN
ncbi:M56 family metallopeptidase [Chitinophaga defluvii]|uniref:M56 family metallopeptidase n=1 Tax=Chitinophaga defluvii TaxID=3163343 RepID=A0ABV2T0U6_9BACT